MNDVISGAATFTMPRISSTAANERLATMMEIVFYTIKTYARCIGAC
jgi:hypothetical protein